MSTARAHIPVPVEAARQIADRYEKTVVVILAYDPLSELIHTTTYGRGAQEKEVAAWAGEQAAKAVGCDLQQKRTYADFAEPSTAARNAHERDQLLRLTRLLDEHPAGYDGPCECKLCCSYGDPAPEAANGL